MSDKSFEMTLLFDFFGDLLTEKQREYFDLYYNNDLSLSEISEITGISRQGVRDNLIRTENLLKEFEEKTGVVSRFRQIQDRITELESELSQLENICTDDDARSLAKKIAQGLRELKG